MTITTKKPDILAGLAANGKIKKPVVTVDIANSSGLGESPAVKVEPKKLKMFNYQELLDMEVPEVEWIIPNVLPKGLVSGIVAQSGTGKTWLAYDLMRTLAAGGTWAGKYLVEARKVAFIDLEGDYVTMKQRIKLMEAGDPHGVPAEARGRLLFNSDLGQIDVAAPKSTDEEVSIVDEIIDMIKENGIEIVFIDSLSKTHYEDENSERMKAVMSALEHIARVAGCTVVVIHHMGKDSARGARGSSAIKAAFQHVIELNAGQENTEGLAKGVKVSLTKAKSSPMIPFMTTFSLEATLDDKKNVTSVRCVYSDEDIVGKGSDKVSAIDKTKAYIVTRCELSTKPYKTRQQIVETIVANKVSGKSTAQEAIKQLILEGALAVEGEFIRARNVTTGEVL
jgi:KaiC/GvpD/RAD55 family RecA-like ATPase